MTTTAQPEMNTEAVGCGCGAAPTGTTKLGRGARRARGVAGLGFLAVAGALAGRRLPGGVALWPAALVPAWFGISHLIAAQIGYRGCPELGAIPSVIQARWIETECGPWERFDRRFGLE